VCAAGEGSKVRTRRGDVNSACNPFFIDFARPSGGVVHVHDGPHRAGDDTLRRGSSAAGW
jgi:hypothetical protein